MSRAAPRLVTAFGVALAAVGCAPAGPAAPAAAVEPLRRAGPVAPGLSALHAGNPRGARVVLVHGTPGTATGWADYLLAPPPGVELVAIDRPGFGHSAPAGAVPVLAAQAAAVLSLLPADGRPLVLLGHSLGGPVVAWAAALAPARVHGLVLLAASLDPALETTHPLQHVGAWPPVRALLPRALRNANAELMALKGELQALEPLLAGVRAKVVIVHGTDDDLVPVANVRFAQSRLAGARCLKTVLLEGHDHFLPWKAAPQVRAAIAEALGPAC